MTEERARAEYEKVMREMAEHDKEFKRTGRKIRITLFLLILLFLVPCSLGMHYSSLPRTCDVRVATVTEVISNRHCSMGCRGYDHLVQFSGIRGVTERYVGDDDRVWRVAGPGDRIRVNVCTVKGYESSPPEIEILGRAP